MLGSNLPSNSRAEGCVDAQRVHLESPGRMTLVLVLLGDVFCACGILRPCGSYRRREGFCASAIVPKNNRPPPPHRCARAMAGKIPGVWGQRPRVERYLSGHAISSPAAWSL
jgi:hypothetical protein